MSLFLLSRGGKIMDLRLERDGITEKHIKTFEKWDKVRNEIKSEYENTAFRNAYGVALDLKRVPKYNETLINTILPYSAGYMPRTPERLDEGDYYLDLHWPREYKEDLAFLCKRHGSWLQMFIDDYWAFASHLYKCSQVVHYRKGSMTPRRWDKDAGLRSVKCQGKSSDIYNEDLPYILLPKNPFSPYMRKYKTVKIRYVQLDRSSDLEGAYKKGIKTSDVQAMGVDLVVYNGILRPEDFWWYWCGAVGLSAVNQKAYIGNRMQETVAFKQCSAICQAGRWNLNNKLYDCYHYVFDDNQLMYMLADMWVMLTDCWNKSKSVPKMWGDTILGDKMEMMLGNMPELRKLYATPTVYDKSDGFKMLMQYHYIFGFTLLDLGITREYVVPEIPDRPDSCTHYDITEFKRVFCDTVQSRLETVKNTIYPVLQDIYKLRNIKLAEVQTELLKR